MRSFVFRAIAICANAIVIGALASCSTIPHGGSDKCGFKYGAQVRDSIVVPAMRKAIGDRTDLYDTDTPLVHLEKDRVSLSFYYRSKGFIDGPIFEMDIDPCSYVVIKARETQGIPNDPE